MSKITEKLVKSLEPTERDVFKWDSELRGFGVRVNPAGPSPISFSTATNTDAPAVRRWGVAFV